MSLHPDKLAALNLIAEGASPTDREPVAAQTEEQRQVDAAATRAQVGTEVEPLEQLAYNLHSQHIASHLNRLKSRAKIGAPEAAPKPPQIVFQLPGVNANG